MNTNENIRNNASEDVIVLGVASVETQGGPGSNEAVGFGGPVIPGISEE
ncbi:MAG: benenodin family lasso peptide [Rhodanobacter sp.]|nr:benenodin family lasso peptide [Rhodanobacter sp. 115]TAM25555.1 MAG: benenodin family lasso peptide [Rhodanobacter sp.]